jgi:hypothetical protein
VRNLGFCKKKFIQTTIHCKLKLQMQDTSSGTDEGCRLRRIQVLLSLSLPSATGLRQSPRRIFVFDPTNLGQVPTAPLRTAAVMAAGMMLLLVDARSP